MIDTPRYRVGKHPTPGEYDEYFTNEAYAIVRCYELNKGRSGSDPNADYEVWEVATEDDGDTEHSPFS